MAAPRGTIRVRQDQQALLVRVEGQVTMENSPPLRRYVEQLFAAGATALRIDLGCCTYMDSTFLGTLFILKRNIDQRGTGTFVLTGLSPQCRRILHQVGLENFYTLQAGEELPPEAWTELPTGRSDNNTMQQNILQAHQELANLPGPAGDPFREVMRCVAQDMEKRRTAQAPPPPAKQPDTEPR